ncbi:MAG: 8-amino-7-oxononanoate synthase [Pseudomonadota bacterium]
MRQRLSERLQSARQARETAGLNRARESVEAIGPGLQVRRGDQALIDFSSNDYLGFGHRNATLQTHASASASPLVSGHSTLHAELESALCEFTGFEACCLFPSGYQANVAVGQALCERGDHALVDRLNHASLNDGLRLAGARLKRFHHGDAGDAEQRWTPDCQLLVSDSVFSMDGDIAPLPALVDLADDKNLGLWIDDAHGLGVIGQNGRGIIEAFDLRAKQVDVYIATFGKSLGSAGAVVAGERALIEHLENHARGLIYSTALAPALVELTLQNLRRLQDEPEHRVQLHDNIRRFRSACQQLDLALQDSETAIQILPIGDNRSAMNWSHALAQAGFLVKAIRPPTVPAGTARLRLTLSAAHSPQDIDRLCESLGEIARTHADTAA